MSDIEERALEQLDRLAAARTGSVEAAPWNDIARQVDTLYDSGGLPRGSSTGWSGLDKFFTVATGQWTLVSGMPGMGKSEWLDALVVNLCESGEWVACYWSPENWPASLHAVKLMEKRTRKPFNRGFNERMSKDEMQFAGKWVRSHVTFMAGESATLLDVLHSTVRVGARPERKLAVVIDPWNYLNHHDPTVRLQGQNETEYVSHVLSSLTSFLRSEEGQGVHVFMVAHPAKMYRLPDGKYPTPDGYSVSGSAHWFNKADNIIVLSRDKVDETQDVQIVVQKVRFKHIGHMGTAYVKYDKVTGRYFEAPTIIDRFTRKPEQYRDPSGAPNMVGG